MGKKKKEKEKLKFSKKIIILMFASMFIFTIVMILTYWFCGGVPDSLIEPFFTFFGLEGGALGVIKVSETITENIDFKRSKKK